MESEKKDLTVEIINRAEDKAKTIVSLATDYEKDLIKKVNEDLATEKEKQRKIIKEEAEEIIKRRNADLRLERKKIILNAKNGIIDSVFCRVYDRLKDMDEESELRLISSLIMKYAEEGDEVILSENSKLSEKQVLEIDGIKKLSLTLKKNGKFDGGIILSGKKFDKDLTYKSLLKSAKEKYGKEVADKLF